MLIPVKAFASLDARVLPASRREAERLQARVTALAEAGALKHQARLKLWQIFQQMYLSEQFIVNTHGQ